MNNVNKFVLSLSPRPTSMLLTLIECAVVVYIALCVGRLMGFTLILCCLLSLYRCRSLFIRFVQQTRQRKAKKNHHKRRVGRRNAQIIIEAVATADKEETLVTSTECGSFSVLCVLISNANRVPLKRHRHTHTQEQSKRECVEEKAMKKRLQINISVYKI